MMDTGTGDRGPGTGENPYYGKIALWWQGAHGKVKLGVIQVVTGKWSVGWINERTGGRHKFNSSALSKHHPTKDPEALLQVFLEWAAKRDLRKAEFC